MSFMKNYLHSTKLLDFLVFFKKESVLFYITDPRSEKEHDVVRQ